MKTRSTRDRIEEELAAYFGRRYCCLTNRGTTALTAAFTALNLPQRPAVIFPAALCSIPVFSACFADASPIFSDVSLDDGNFDLSSLEETLESHKGRVRAVVALHMFGQPDCLEELQALCQKHSVSLVEDLALSMGARHGGKRVGGVGRVAVLSFVRKILPVEMGGALLCDEPELAQRARAFIDSLPAAPQNVLDGTALLMKEFHERTGLVAAGSWKDVSLLSGYEQRFRTLLLHRTTENDWAQSIVLDELARLDGHLAQRRARAEVFDTVFNHPRIVPLRNDESCFFAYPVRLLGVCVEDFLAFAQEEGFDFKRIAYPDVHPIFGTRRAYPHAETLEREVMGFPVDEGPPVSAYWGLARDFLSLFEIYLLKKRDLVPVEWRGKLEKRMS